MYRLFGDGHKEEPAWDAAIGRLKKENRDYTFKVESTPIWCNNHAEAANVDYVSPREWSEPYWKLTVEW
jgi:hypothetical protein